MPIASVNPATGRTIREFVELSAADLEARLARAHDAFRRWRRTPVAARAEMISRLGALLDAEKEQLGRTMALEMGKPLRAAIEEAAKCAAGCRYYARHAEAFLAPERVPDGDEEGYVLYQPVGVVLAVMPWNFPFWQTVRFLAPALVAGNVGLLKHASNVPQCALLIEELVRRAGAPEGVFQTLLIGSKRVRTVLEDDRVAAATLTGSEAAGSDVASMAGARKRTVCQNGKFQGITASTTPTGW